MKLLINRGTLILELQQKFTQKYPYLKIEFFKVVDGQTAGSLRGNKMSPHLTLIEAGTTGILTAELIIEDSMSVLQLEKAFLSLLGLKMELFRRSGNIWLEASVTDGWSLKQQNDLGREISTMRNIGPDEGRDADRNRDAQ